MAQTLFGCLFGRGGLIRGLHIADLGLFVFLSLCGLCRRFGLCGSFLG